MGYSLPDPFIHGIFRTRILEWVASSAGDPPDPGIEHMAPAVTPVLQENSLLLRLWGNPFKN